MKEINISRVLISKRKEKGITQEGLAAYIGVSKASVSKWETGQSYPDITFLPQLATYFNISIDELIGYTPQLTKEQIAELYHQLADAFASQPFEQVYGECEEIIKKYYSCFPLLMQMTVLYLNHHMQAPGEQKNQILEETLDLCCRIRDESKDDFLSRDAAMVMAHCFLLLEKPEEVLALFGETLHPIHSETGLLAQAYLLLGKMDKSLEVTQVNMYQHLLALMESSTQLVILSAQDPAKVDMIMKRALETAKTFQLEKLHPNSMAILALTGAQVYCNLGSNEKAIELLKLYVETCRNFFPAQLHGDCFFDSIDGWLKNFDLGKEAPRSESAIKKSLLTSISENPALAPLTELAEFQSILGQIQSIIGGN